VLTIDILRDRASMLKKARAFFEERNILEVDCPALGRYANIDSYIDVIEASISERESGFFHTSPEYSMKQLLSNKSGDIYFLGHVFRFGDIGTFHNPEFTMAEWYRIDVSFTEMIFETCQFLTLFLGDLPIKTMSYRQAFKKHIGIDPVTASFLELQSLARSFSACDSSQWDRYSYINFLLNHGVQPYLGKKELTILTDYPSDIAALAQIVEKDGEAVAERFEIYYEGIELANGYRELTDSEAVRERCKSENQIRSLQNKKTYDLNENFLSSVRDYFPECCGVSVGFDRALMLKHRVQSIGEVLPFAWLSNS